MTDLIHLMSKLVSPAGKILIPGIMDEVAPLSGNHGFIFILLLITCRGGKEAL
jgi:Cys-Gly metallodipeptidase DUG1